MAETNGQDAEEQPYKDLTGRVVKSSEICLAIGGFSDVYAGVYTDENGVSVPVAIKILRIPNADAAAQKTTRRRLNRESRLWHTLVHPNIVPFLGIADGLGASPALISPLYVSGHALRYVSDNPRANRINLVIGVAQALVYLHSQGVVHGDMKGHNVLVDDCGVARLADFGRSKIIDHRGFTTVFSGSARYMAPELLGPPIADLTRAGNDFGQISFVPVLTTRTDVFGFAMVALEIVTGKKSWYYLREESMIVSQVQNGRRPSRDKYQCSVLSDGLWSLLCDCWTEQPDARPNTTTVLQRLRIHALAA